MRNLPKAEAAELARMNSLIISGMSSCLAPALATLLLIAGGTGSARAETAGCSGDSGGIILPPGFCATVFADQLGHVRHMVVAPNGVLYANTWSGRYFRNDSPPAGGFVIALQSTANDGRADKIVRFGPTLADGNAGGTGIDIYKSYLYAETNDRIVRYALPTDRIEPAATTETVVSGLPLTGDHPMHPFKIDAKGNLYVDLGSATNSCQSENRMPNAPGMNPCMELQTRAGTWRYDANKLNQRFSPVERFATGLRNGEGFGIDSAGRVFATQHGRDQLAENFPRLYRPEQGANEPAEELVQLRQGADFGWPECYYDYSQKRLVLAPEYGGDGGKTVGICAQKQAPVAAFPAHWAPNDLLIYQGKQFPSAYKDGAFIAFHGSWNRAPSPQGGYNVVFQPLHDGKASGPFVVFADGFAGAVKEPGRAAHRPTGLAVAPDGSMYISDDRHGRIWHVTFRGAGNVGVTGVASAPSARSASRNASPPEGINPVSGLHTPPGSSPDQVALGGRIFHGQEAGGSCSGCHGSDGKGSTVGSDLTSGKYLWGDGSIAAIMHTIENGVPKAKEHTGAMPPKGGANLTQADVAALADYVWALGHRSGQ
jgi:glucose/arabinose dehydrogenase/mono/diheme cytochrome c family protein